MREIKFRAFIKFNKTMLNVANIDFKRKEVSLFSEAPKPNPCDRYKFDDIELMQYTGLLDKNGVEIYEGDIVGGTLSDGTNGKSEVFWGYNCYQPFSYLGCISEDLEVIGNIYENPELLN